MNRSTKKGLTAGALALGLLLAGSSASAETGFRGGREGAPGRGLRAALSTLDLSEAQKTKMQELLEGQKAKFEALRNEGRAAREALRGAVESATPDPAAVGAAFLRLDAHRKAIRAERESSRKQLESLLTAEQKAKLEGWRSAHRQIRRAALRMRRGGPDERGPRPPID